ncbi:hypothetical protein CS022_18485 [Veronia nyctiphanis]|uniref:Uncharacterized protein n=1 Tax=Veronia nyctiphanis TaxID=1278244 RepID=A0A4Q0YMB3_9GAMM|nr:hypothetical protein [Veronia nyctiphanis]RXJ71987.1 hypothetical protein CS022_18485 [Veronia nyctiphanis]
MRVNEKGQQRRTMRNPRDVMQPERLGAMHQTRISFVRSLLRKMIRENWTVAATLWDMNPQGYGTSVYTLTTPENDYQLIVFSNAIEDHERCDRVIAEKWDVTFALVRGKVSDDDLENLRQNVPLQEAGRNSTQVLVLARANKSVRVFEHLVAALSQGSQPDGDILASVGYILRTTAVYGNGKFGIADFETLANSDFSSSFSAQMCAVFILRQFSLDWVHYLAEIHGGDNAVTLAPEFQRYLGVGNATGLGMAPYLLRHPCVVDQWMTQREHALSDVLEQPVEDTVCNTLVTYLNMASVHLSQVITIDDDQRARNHKAAEELPVIAAQANALCRQTGSHWRALMEYASHYSFDAQEALVACLLELYPDLVDRFEQQMNTVEEMAIQPGVTVGEMVDVLERRYQWALDIDFSEPENQYWFWYRSQDKEEPRLGVRGEEPGEEHELPLDVGRQVNAFYAVLKAEDRETSLARFLLENPRFRQIARRSFTLGNREMGDIQINSIGQHSKPMHLLRCKLSMFGATKFDPRSDRWVRVTLFQGAPLLDDLSDKQVNDHWIFPVLPVVSPDNNKEREQHQ